MEITDRNACTNLSQAFTEPIFAKFVST